MAPPEPHRLILANIVLVGLVVDYISLLVVHLRNSLRGVKRLV
jgi:hypothetical protein